MGVCLPILKCYVTVPLQANLIFYLIAIDALDKPVENKEFGLYFKNSR